MFASTIRIIKFAVQDFFRNFWLTLVTLTILVLALLTVNTLIVLNALTDKAVEEVKNKIDIAVYFKNEITEEQVYNVNNYFESLEEVKEVKYISKEEALENFKERHQDNPRIVDSLKEIQENPLGHTLVIKARSADDYPKLLEILQTPQYDELIEDKDFEDYQLIIDRINAVTGRVTQTGTVVAGIFLVISVLIIFNAIRMTIYTHRQEITAMKLVGATDFFVSAPFLLVGILYAVVSLGISFLILYPMLGFVQPYIANFFENQVFSLVDYFSQNFVVIAVSQFVVLVVLVLISSIFAVRKYLKV